jgi:glutamine amidotransferase/cyclase
MAGGLYLLDYGAGNVRSLANSLAKIGYEFEWIKSPEDFDKAEVSTPHTLIFEYSSPKYSV